MSGTISTSTTWTVAGSPYVLDGWLYVRGEGPTVLTIEPGVVVKVGSDLGIVIGQSGTGELQAVGTADRPIVFTTIGSVAPGTWRGLLFSTNSGNSRLEHAVVEGGGKGNQAGVRVAGAAPVLKDVTVRASYHRGIGVEANGAPEVVGSTVTGTAGGDGTGIHVAGGARLAVSDTIVSGNANAAITVEPGAELSGLTGMVLTGNGRDGVRHRGGELARDETWRSFGYPYFLTDAWLYVRGEGRTVLTIEPGVVVKVGNDLGITIGELGTGELRAVGTADRSIAFTTAGPVAPGSWRGLLFGANSGGSRLEHAVVEGGGKGNQAGVRVTGAGPVLKDVTVRASSHRGIGVEAGGAPEVVGSTVTGTSGGDGTGIHVGTGGRLTVSDTVVSGNTGSAISVEAGAALHGLTGVVLTANGRDGVRHRGGELVGNETWKSFGYPYFLTDGWLYVRGAGGPTLTIEPGVVVKVGSDLAISIGEWGTGELRAVGTAEKPILITTAGPVGAGAWRGLSFGANSGGSRLEHVIVEGGGRGYLAGVRVEGAAPALRNVTVRASYHRGISLEAGAAPAISGSTVIGTTGGEGTGIYLSPGSAARIELTSASANGGAGISNEGSRSWLRFVTCSGNGAEGLRSASGGLRVRDGAVTGQAVPMRNVDAGSGVVDARHHWWGTAGGPSGLAGRIEYDPWLAEPPTPGFAVTSLEASTRAIPAGQSNVRYDFELPSSSRWSLRFLAPDGSEARRFEGTGRAATVTWDGTGPSGMPVADGSYLFRLEAAEDPGGRAAAPLVGRITLDTQLPVAILGSPSGLVRARAGDELAIEGSAGGPGFQSYVLEAGPGDFPAEWKLVDRGILPVASARLGSWTTALLAPGWHTLRLTVVGAAGKTASATARVELVDDGACR